MDKVIKGFNLKRHNLSITQETLNKIIYDNTTDLRKSIQVLKATKTKLQKKKELLIKQNDLLKEEINKLNEELGL